MTVFAPECSAFTHPSSTIYVHVKVLKSVPSHNRSIVGKNISIKEVLETAETEVHKGFRCYGKQGKSAPSHLCLLPSGKCSPLPVTGTGRRHALRFNHSQQRLNHRCPSSQTVIFTRSTPIQSYGVYGGVVWRRKPRLTLSSRPFAPTPNHRVGPKAIKRMVASRMVSDGNG